MTFETQRRVASTSLFCFFRLAVVRFADNEDARAAESSREVSADPRDELWDAEHLEHNATWQRWWSQARAEAMGNRRQGSPIHSNRPRMNG